MAEPVAAPRTALAGLALPIGGPQAWVRDVGPLCRFVCRGDAGIFGVALPQRPCRAEIAGLRAALWLGPDEWLLIAPAGEAASLCRGLREAVAGRAASVVDVSHRNAGLVAEGPMANQLLAAGCPLDLDPDVFPVGMATRTLFVKAEIVLWRPAPEVFRLEVGRSFAPYLVGQLTEALRDL